MLHISYFRLHLSNTWYINSLWCCMTVTWLLLCVSPRQTLDIKRGVLSRKILLDLTNSNQPGFWALITEQIEVGGAANRACPFASSRKEAARPAADRAWPDSESTSAPFNTSGTKYRMRSIDFSRSGEASESTAHTQQHEAEMTWLAGRPVQRLLRET